MTLVLELSRPFQWKPGVFKDHCMYRAWWGPFAVGVIRISFRQFCERPLTWITDRPQ